MLLAHGLGAAGRDAPVISVSTISRSADPEPGHHQMRGTPPVCMHTGQEGTGSMPEAATWCGGLAAVMVRHDQAVGKSAPR
jgi:hypothetical protein